MRLASFIHENEDIIVGEWENFARTLVGSVGMTPLALRDHIREILAFIASDIESSQSGVEQVQKSHGGKKKNSRTSSAAETHAALRLAGGFDIDEMVSEYRALRASIVKLWVTENKEPTQWDMQDMTRFHEAIDQELAESVNHYTKEVTHSKDLFLGILSHDLRTPLSAALMSAQLIPQIGPLSERQAALDLQIVECVRRANQIVANLFDLTRGRFGAALPALKAPMNMELVARQVVEEIRIVYPERIINLYMSGDLKGQWDQARIGQVFSNLIGNAVQHGFKEQPVDVRVDGNDIEVIVSVSNQGNPIPATKIEKIFDSLTSLAQEGSETRETHLGLGLYITKEVVAAHDGTIGVKSSAKDGTTFTARFPR